jgi:hypothetical protein
MDTAERSFSSFLNKIICYLEETTNHEICKLFLDA